MLIAFFPENVEYYEYIFKTQELTYQKSKYIPVNVVRMLNPHEPPNHLEVIKVLDKNEQNTNYLIKYVGLTPINFFYVDIIDLLFFLTDKNISFEILYVNDFDTFSIKYDVEKKEVIFGYNVQLVFKNEE